MDEPKPRSSMNRIVGGALAVAFVGTIIWSVAQDADDDGDRPSLEDEMGDIADSLDEDTIVTFDEVGEPIEPPISVVIPDELVPDEPLDTGMYTLTVHTDGCGIIRTTRPEELRNLSWVIEDEDGFEVLSRLALDEDRYRYFQSGTYTVVLRAYGAGYEDVSNTLTIHCDGAASSP